MSKASEKISKNNNAAELVPSSTKGKSKARVDTEAFTAEPDKSKTLKRSRTSEVSSRKSNSSTTSSDQLEGDHDNPTKVGRSKSPAKKKVKKITQGEGYQSVRGGSSLF